MMSGTPDIPFSAGESEALLARVRAGDEEALDRLFTLTYDHLHRTAGALLRSEGPGHTLQPTALVHELWLKLSGGGPPPVASQAHFLGIAARAMRQVLVDHARRRQAGKRGDGRIPARISQVQVGVECDIEELIALDDALAKLGELNPRLRELVELRFFGGLTEEEIAATLDVTTRTVQRDWVKARAWLHQALGKPSE
jgi:RNA polymerase sigma factor (TIGR02999 family)